MTGIERPWLWSLPTRVELAEGAVIRFEQPGQAGLAFEQSQIDKMFEVGLMEPPRTTERDPNVLAGVTLDGDARFLVGQVDLGRDVGVEVLVRGFEAAVDASARELRNPHPQAPAAPSPGEGKPHGFREEDARLRVMTIDEAADQWHELLPGIERWERVALTQDGRRVALIVAWDWWALHRHRTSSIEAVYWSSWFTGEFNVGGYAWDLMRLLEPRDARIKFPDDEVDGDVGPDEQPG